ncbi:MULTISPECIES: YfbU family protein [unclassified Paenibacillus]|uniref:YfbU family protein n=1 Tax=unclassified Paenibacillus TaxID=185978 RepID=UPI00247710E5|nr:MULTISPECIES: YfbU family protein [unclassified Paenibacillus]MDH6427264.1 uncharacterized protein YfbU (UPF0304 family) [Paenibacillus sp. PastH-4]MDH6443294.1 uncharacterized protein YfbU (UPF0304 family) [Paenibacillus sp. PastF-4]MDH6526002.1 uncharacterized protein YfbU (UPF0304 family) [Paenibacillus sp. PastH-3]
MDLSMQERLLLYNQYDILERLNPEDAETYQNYKNILQNGYKYHYDDIVHWFSDEMSEEASQLVGDVLDMYSSLLNSYSNLEDKNGIDERRINFPGFDGNNETREIGYTRFFLNDLGRFSELRQNGHNQYNSHRRMIPKYREMLRVWSSKNVETRYSNLSKEEINEIINA